jgi:uncharacterized membrane protein HdeD (DUF308 family)
MLFERRGRWNIANHWARALWNLLLLLLYVVFYHNPGDSDSLNSLINLASAAPLPKLYK